jgi:glucose dehydrogenase
MKPRSENRSLLTLAIAAALILSGAIQALAQQGTKNGEWRAIGGDPGNTKYAPLGQINRDNFKDLQVAFTWDSISNKVM